MIDKKLYNSEQKIRELREQLKESQKCSMCHDVLFRSPVSSDVSPYKIGDKSVCRKCYLDNLGEEIEKHPIGIAPRRG